MPGVRLDRLLASTAIVLLLSGAAGGALAEPMTDQSIGATVPVPDTSNITPPVSANADKAAVTPAEPTDAPVNTPATTASIPPAPAPATSTDTSTNAPTSEPETPAPAAAVTPSLAQPTDAASQPTDATSQPAAAVTPSPAQPSDATSQPAAAVTPPATPESAAPTVAAAPAASAGSLADAAIAEELHQLDNGKFDRILGGKKDRTMIGAFYSGRSYAPLWITDGKENDRAKAAIGYLGHVDADGLDPADYQAPNFAAVSDPTALAEAELRLTMAVVTYAHHAQIGRVHWSRVSADISYDEKAPEPADVLAAMVATTDVAAALDAYEPHNPAYLALKAKLAEIRGGKGDAGKPAIANGTAPRIGAKDDRVPELRDRLGVPDDGSTTYDKALADAVKKFQQAHDIKPTGTLTSATIEALNGHHPDRAADIILANMERWRWMPHDLGKTYVIVNLPDYSLRVMHDGKQVWVTKIVIGKPAMPTPLMSGEMKFITINPTWNVPPSIVNNEYLPALRQDPTVLERMGLKVSHNPDGTIHISQPPGDKNALGRIRFNFPNKFLVYQHDTPDKYMFAYEKRAFSHGCMRVFNPPKYAEVLLSLVRPGDGYTQERIKRMYGPSEVNIEFPKFIPVHLTYQTAFVDEAGKLEFREDVYGRDRALLALLKGDERKIADIPVEHRENITHRQVLAMPDQPSLFNGNRGGNRGFGVFGGNQGNGGDNFFARLFGAPTVAPPPPKPLSHKRVTQRRTEYR